VDYRINIEPDGTDPAAYYSRQRRFDDGAVDLDATRKACADRMRRLHRLAS
jgi:hypothetical protein